MDFPQPHLNSLQPHNVRNRQPYFQRARKRDFLHSQLKLQVDRKATGSCTSKRKTHQKCKCKKKSNK